MQPETQTGSPFLREKQIQMWQEIRTCLPIQRAKGTVEGKILTSKWYRDHESTSFGLSMINDQLSIRKLASLEDYLRHTEGLGSLRKGRRWYKFLSVLRLWFKYLYSTSVKTEETSTVYIKASGYG